MTDTALIVGGAVAQVWRGTPASSLPKPGGGTLVEFQPEDHVTCSQLWDGRRLSNPPAVEDKRAEAQAALNQAKDVALTALLTGKEVPPDWKAYGAQLVEIAAAEEAHTDALPEPPEKPA